MKEVIIYALEEAIHALKKIEEDEIPFYLPELIFLSGVLAFDNIPLDSAKALLSNMREIYEERRMNLKKCTRCKQAKECNAFSKDSSRRDGLSNRCRECNKELRKLKGRNNK